MATMFVPGLNAQQVESLQDVQLGDFIWITYHAPDPELDHVGSDGPVEESSATEDDEGDAHAEGNVGHESGSEAPSDAGVDGSVDGSESSDEQGDESNETNLSFTFPVLDTTTGAPTTEGNLHSTNDEDDEFPTEVFGGFDGLCLVSRIITTNGKLTDLHLVRLEAEVKARGNHSPHDYQVYGRHIVHTPDESCTHDPADCDSLMTLSEIAAERGIRNIDFKRRPSAYLLRESDFEWECPAQCNDGWLAGMPQLLPLIKDYVSPALVNHRVVCPVCLGLTIMKEQQMLRATLDQVGLVDLGLVVEWLGRLNQLRARSGYEFCQFDERDWGYLFDDMLSDDDEANGDDTFSADEQDAATQDPNAVYYEQWAEAMDPNSEVHRRTRPLSKDIIGALPRRKLHEVKTADAETQCLVCRDEFEDEQTIVQLPCKHYFCDHGCIEQWLRQYDSCPTCRATVSSAPEGTVQESAGDGSLRAGGETRPVKVSEISS